MSEQIGWRGVVRRVRLEAPNWGAWLPQMPRLVHRVLAAGTQDAIAASLAVLAREQRRQTVLLILLVVLMGAVVIALLRVTG
jgi:ubiquinone biosynthesis protein